MEPIERDVCAALVRALENGMGVEDVQPEADFVEEYGLDSLHAIPFLLDLQTGLDVDLEPELLDQPRLRTVLGLSAYLAEVARPFRLALVGAGRMGRTHLRALAQCASVRVEDVVEPLPEPRRSLAAQGFRTHRSLEALLLDGERPEGVLVAVPTDRHAEVVRSAVAAGLPVLCEKPAGLTSAEVAGTGAHAADCGVFQVAYWRRHLPALQRLRERILAGALGDIHLVTCWQWDASPPRAEFRGRSGGIFIDMGVHEIDEIRWLTGQEVTGVEAVASPMVSDPAVRGDVDSAQALLELSGGATAVVSLGRHFPEADMAAVEVFGTCGHERVVFLDPTGGEAPMLDALRRQAVAFAGLVRGRAGPGAGVADAVAALRTAERATRAAGMGAAVGLP
jgi:myo-inositol 2-dehydrogenase / D-chiro-inositol 1-dehydrogenase